MLAVARSSGSDQVNAYLQAVVRAHLEGHGKSDASFARACGITPGALNAIKNGGRGGGMRALEAIAHGLGRKPWEMYREALGGGRVDASTSGEPPLRDLPSWPAVAERARLAVDELDAPLVDEVGGFVPPAPIERVTVALVTALVGAWKGVRPAPVAPPPVARRDAYDDLAPPAVETTLATEKSGKAKRKK